MYEIRLIDANALPKCEVHTKFGNKDYTAIADVPYCQIESAPTIDPETLPIVRELREELKRTKEELEESRKVPTIGRCKDCANKEKAVVNAKGFLVCPASGMEITDEDFCSYFEPKPDRKDLAPMQPIDGLGSEEGTRENCVPGVAPERSGK